MITESRRCRPQKTMAMSDPAALLDSGSTALVVLREGSA
jgi:hypothetical protein